MPNPHEKVEAPTAVPQPDKHSEILSHAGNSPGDMPPTSDGGPGGLRNIAAIDSALNKPLDDKDKDVAKADVDPAIANSVKDLIIKAQADLATIFTDRARDNDHRQLHDIFSKLTTEQGDAVMASIRPALAEHNLTVARVENTGEIWTGSRSSAKAPFSTNAQLLEPKSGS